MAPAALAGAPSAVTRPTPRSEGLVAISALTRRSAAPSERGSPDNLTSARLLVRLEQGYEQQADRRALPRVYRRITDPVMPFSSYRSDPATITRRRWRRHSPQRLQSTGVRSRVRVRRAGCAAPAAFPAS